ncbi:hypothetical protein FLA_0744 [Filimonas lacunae]|nr:hypothetical protein FLA_0744 [Filimonas lacunae]
MFTGQLLHQTNIRKYLIRKSNSGAEGVVGAVVWERGNKKETGFACLFF